jgi:hypothetical protein
VCVRVGEGRREKGEEGECNGRFFLHITLRFISTQNVCTCACLEERVCVCEGRRNRERGNGRLFIIPFPLSFSCKYFISRDRERVCV